MASATRPLNRFGHDRQYDTAQNLAYWPVRHLDGIGQQGDIGL
jgi:hypothetical protein